MPLNRLKRGHLDGLLVCEANISTTYTLSRLYNAGSEIFCYVTSVTPGLQHEQQQMGRLARRHDRFTLHISPLRIFRSC